MYYNNPNIYTNSQGCNMDQSTSEKQYSLIMPNSYEEAWNLYAHNQVSSPKTIGGLITFANGFNKNCTTKYYLVQLPDMYKSIIFGKWKNYWYRITIYNYSQESSVHYWNGPNIKVLSYLTTELSIKNILLDILEGKNDAKMMDILELITE